MLQKYLDGEEGKRLEAQWNLQLKRDHEALTRPERKEIYMPEPRLYVLNKSVPKERTISIDIE